MKKLMKAIAFATVMCMLLSVSAFAAVETPVLNEDLDLTVKVTASGTEQVAILVLKEGTALAAASNENILYVNQAAAVDNVATFDVVLNPTTLGSGTKVDVYAGYASNGANDAVFVKGVDVVTAKELAIVLDGDIEVIPDVTKTAEFENVKADFEKLTDIGALVYATVQFQNLNNESVNAIGWEFANGDDKRYIYYDLEGFNAIAAGSKVQFGVAFTNGSTVAEQNRPQFVDDETEVNVWFQVGTREGMKATK